MGDDSPPSVIAALSRALEMMRNGERGPELEQQLSEGVVGALNARIGERDLELTAQVDGPDGTSVIVGGHELEPGRLLIELVDDGHAAKVYLDLRGGTVPEPIAHVPTCITYQASELPNDHRWWSDVGGLLMLGELARPGA